LPCIKQELAHQGFAKITIGAFDQQQVAKIPCIPEIGQIVRTATFAFNFAGQFQPELRLTDQIKGSIGQRDVLFNHWRMAAPFADPMRQHQRVVAKAQQEFKQSLILVHHIAPTSSGMSKNVGWR